MRRLGRLLRAAGLALLGITAVFGVTLAAAGLLASTGPGSRWVAGRLAGTLEGVVAGRFTLGGVTVEPGGDLELRELELVDPAGHRVIRVGRARARLELRALARRLVGVELELDQPEVILEPGAQGRLTIADALAPAAAPGAGATGGDPWRGWTIRVTRLRLREGTVAWRGSGEQAWLEVSGVQLDGAGRLGSAGVAAGLELTGTLAAPLQGPLAIDLGARIEGTRLTVQRLALGADSSRLEVIGEWDWARETFRAAATRVALSRRDLEAVAGRRDVVSDLEGRLYAESDGRRLTASVELDAAGGKPGGARGGGSAALALKLGGGSPRTIGFDTTLVELDPSRLLSRAPRGRISVAGRGALAWPVPAPGPFSRGHLTVDRLEVALPGLDVKGEGRWRDAGAMSGALRLEASDLGAAGPAVAALLGVSLPALSGQARASLTLAGTAAAPEATLTLQVPDGAVAEVPLTDGRAELKLSGSAVELAASAALGLIDGATVSVRSAATLTPDWRRALLGTLEVGLAGQAWTLAAPATLTFDPVQVDRAELRSGAQQLAISGGLGADGVAQARLEVREVELAHLPRALVPPSLGLDGRAGGTIQVAGSAARRTLDAQVEVVEGALASLGGLGLKAGLAWRRETGRATVEAALRRAEGGTLDLSADLPWPVAGAGRGAAVAGRVAFGGWAVQALLGALRVDLTVDGRVAGELTLAGSVGAPRLGAQAAVVDGSWADVAPLALTATLEGTGPTLRAAAVLTRADAEQARATVELPFDRGALLAHPGRTLGRLAEAAWSGRLQLLDTELGSLAGTAGLPAGLSGRVGGEASLQGTPVSPRGAGTFDLAGVALAGYPTLDGRVSLALEQARTAVTAQLTSGGAPALRLVASVAAPVEQLGSPEVQRRAPVELHAEISRLDLPGEPGKRWSVAGKATARLDGHGTLAAPRATLALEASGLTLGGLPLGDLAGTVRTGDGESRVDLTLAPEDGGTLRIEGTLGAVPGIQATAEALLAAPLQLAVEGRQLDIGFLPPFLPGVLRGATGKVETSLTVTGSPRAPRLAGTAALAGGTVTLPSWGTFTGLGFEATLDRQAARLENLTIHRGDGRVEGRVAVEGLDAAEPRLTGSLTVTDFSFARAGMNVATIDARATLGGRLHEGRAEVEVTVAEGGAVRLPRKSPRALQPIEDRPDIVIGGEPSAPAGGAGPEAAPGVGRRAEPALAVSIRVRSQSFLVKSDQPRVHVELRTDSTWDVTASPLRVAGSLDAVQGSFEPLAGRLFKVVRGHVGFTGGALEETGLDLAADYEAATTKVHASVTGTIRAPTLRLTSEPPLDEAALAMLIVTGRTQMTVGGTASSTTTTTTPAFSAQDAGMAAAMAMTNRVFEEKLGEKMPLDSLTLDTTAVTAGKQLTDRTFVLYMRRFDARPEKGENTDEVRVQYHLTQHWTLESRYGNAGAGGASFMWQKDY